MTSLKTYIDVIGRDLASGAFRSAGASATKMGATVKVANAGIQTSMNKMSRYFLARDIGAGMLRIGKGVIRAFGAATEAAGEFEYGMASVGAVTNATAAEMRMLGDAATKAGIETQFSPQQAVDGLRNLATAGQTARQATSTLIPVLDLAAGSLGQLGVGEAANAVVGTLNAYQMSTDRATNVTDKLLRVTQLTNFQARDFSVGLSKAAAAGATFDQSLDDVLITMGLLRNRNVDASVSATAVRESMRRLGADTRAQEAVEKYVKVFDDQGKMRSFVDITRELADATTGLSDKERNATIVRGFGARGLLAFSAIAKAQTTVMENGREVTLKGADAIAHLRRELGDAAGTAKEMRDQLLATAKGQRILLEGTRETLSVKIGEGIAATIAPIVGAITDAGNTMIRILDAIPMPIKQVVAGLGMLSTGAIALTGSVVFLNAMLGMFGIKLRTVGWQIAKVLLIAAPLTALFAGIGVGIFGISRAMDRKTGEMGDSWSDFFGTVKVGFQGVIDLFRHGALSAEVTAELEKADRQGLGQFLSGAAQVISNMKDLWRGMVLGFEAGIDRLEEPLQRLKTTFSTVFGAWFTDVGDATIETNKWSNSGFIVGDALTSISVALIDVANQLLPLAGGFADSFNPAAIRDFAENVATIAEAIAGMVEGLGKIGSFFGAGKAGFKQALGIDVGVGDVLSLGQAYGGGAEGVARAATGRIGGMNLAPQQRAKALELASGLAREQYRLEKFPQLAPQLPGKTGAEAVDARMNQLFSQFGKTLDKMERIEDKRATESARKNKIVVLNNIDWNSIKRGQSREDVDDMDMMLAGELGQSVQGP